MMKTRFLISSAMACCLVASASAETVHQKANGDKAYAPSGGSAVDKKLVEVKEEAKAESGKITRVKASLEQWGFVSYWFGTPAPQGKATLRFRIYVDEEAVADFGVYRISKAGQTFVAKLQIPADAKTKSYVTVDVPVDAKEEWSGVALKKMVAQEKPSLWIDLVSVVLP